MSSSQSAYMMPLELGWDEPTYSTDPLGKLIYTKNQVVLSGNLATLSDIATTDDRYDIFATALLHSPNGHFVTVVGDGEFIIYTVFAWREKVFESGTGFMWAGDSNTYAVLESNVKLHVFKNFKERGGVGMKGTGSWAVDTIYGGPVLGARGKGFVIFLDWGSGDVVKRIDVYAKNISWSTTGSLVAVVSDNSYCILKFDRDACNSKLEEGVEITDKGFEEAFDVIAEISDSVKTVKWIGDCFIYTMTGNRLNYFVGNESYTISPSDTSMFMLGYIPGHNQVYLEDKNMNIFGYLLSLSIIEYQTAVLRGDMDSAAEIFPTLPKGQLDKVARFLEGQDLKELALQVTTDLGHKFDLLLQLNDLDTAVKIARSVLEPESETKWKAIGDRALMVWQFDLAHEGFEKAEGLQKPAATAEEKGANNLGFVTLFQLGDTKPSCILCMNICTKVKVPKVVDVWRGELRTKNKGSIAGSIVHPSEHAELFEEGWEEALAREVGEPVDVNGGFRHFTE
ncbi:coatomer WD associated region-domain-containing protein [Suillus subalutaceus]|uniref:coatomer WD associated region-domain-containing protein n=1 Tax=Suillus subalutaceus TaxID=48586 RepID=UPI001B87A838|nr:coatomer WD associated region-domain-containing protein [Suillus subalutaceus]KAG1834941.1 coatomer WD associated region-domain-containing protein [Suillus subalutaceus]